MIGRFCVCATLGTQQWIWGLNLNETTTWAPWKFVDAQDDGQTAGFVTKFEGGMSFATVHGAGHMVPGDQPARALDMITKFVKGQPLGI